MTHGIDDNNILINFFDERKYKNKTYPILNLK
jgi:hypothetical protein